MKPSFRYLLYTQLWIALGAILLSEQTYLQLALPMQWDHMTLLIGSATLFNYLLQRILAIRVVKRTTLTPLMHWLLRHRWLVYMLLAISGAGIVVGLTGIDRASFILLVVIGAISLLYDIPIGHKRLRDIALLKIFLIALVWASVTVWLPAFHAGMTMYSTNVWMIWGQRLLFILAITLPFDVRDILIDKAYALVTIPRLIGADASDRLSGWLLVVALGIEMLRILIVHHAALIFWQPMVGLLAAYVATLVVIRIRQPGWGDSYYLGLLDGMMILQFLLIWGAIHLPDPV